MEVNFQHCSQNVAIFDPSWSINNCPTEPCHLGKQKTAIPTLRKHGETKTTTLERQGAGEWRLWRCRFYPQLRPGSGSLPTLKEPKQPVANGDKRCCTCKMWSAMCHRKNPSWKKTWPWWHNTSRNQNSKVRRNMVIFKIGIPSTSSSQTIY